jgi:hypothetical protein
MEDVKRFRILAAQECASHLNHGPEGINNYCWMREKANGGTCDLWLKQPKKCPYFMGTVLPLLLGKVRLKRGSHQIIDGRSEAQGDLGLARSFK